MHPKEHPQILCLFRFYSCRLSRELVYSLNGQTSSVYSNHKWYIWRPHRNHGMALTVGRSVRIRWAEESWCIYCHSSRRDSFFIQLSRTNGVTSTTDYLSALKSIRKKIIVLRRRSPTVAGYDKADDSYQYFQVCRVFSRQNLYSTRIRSS